MVVGVGWFSLEEPLALQKVMISGIFILLIQITIEVNISRVSHLGMKAEQQTAEALAQTTAAELAGAKNAEIAAHKVLSVLCDAVVCVGHDLCMSDPCPKLLHVLQHDCDIGDFGKVRFFPEFVVEADRQYFCDNLQRSTEIMQPLDDKYGSELPPSCIHVRLQGRKRCIPAEVFSAVLPNPHGPPHYLLGIRKGGNEQTPETCPEALECGSLADCHAQQCDEDQGEMSLMSAGVANVPMESVASIDFTIDPADPQLRVRRMRIRFQDQVGADQTGFCETAPSLGQWIAHCSQNELAQWIQGEVLASHYNRKAHPCSNFEVHMPFYTRDGDALTLNASQATIIAAVCDDEITRAILQEEGATTHKSQLADFPSSYASQDGDLVLLSLTACALRCHRHSLRPDRQCSGRL